jgi:hypothetical protein
MERSRGSLYLLRLAGVVAVASSLALVVAAPVAGTDDKVTVCHAAGLEGTTHYETLEVPPNEGGFPQGHFTENGTPEAGHEQDYLGACEEEPSEGPSEEPSEAPSAEPGTAAIAVTKALDVDGDVATIDRVPGEGWPFTVTVEGGSPDPASLTTNASGLASTVITIDDGSANVSIGETLGQGVELLDAACVEVVGDGVTEPVGSLEGTTVSLAVNAGDSYECVFVNTSGEALALTAPPTDATGRGPTGGLNVPLILLTLGVVALVATALPTRPAGLRRRR